MYIKQIVRTSPFNTMGSPEKKAKNHATPLKHYHIYAPNTGSPIQMCVAQMAITDMREKDIDSELFVFERDRQAWLSKCVTVLTIWAVDTKGSQIEVIDKFNEENAWGS